MARKRKSNYFWRFVGYVCLYLLLAGSATWTVVWTYRHLIGDQRFAVSQVVVDGGSASTSQELVTELDAIRGQNIFSVDMKAIKATALAHPWVANATVRRELPQRVRLMVQEFQPEGLAKIGSNVMVVTNDGHIICPIEDLRLALDVPVIVGLPKKGYRDAICRASAMLTEIKATSLMFWGSLETLDVSDPNNTVAWLSNQNAPYYLGDRLLAENILNYLSISDHIHETYQNIQYVELGYPHQVAVRPALASK